MAEQRGRCANIEFCAAAVSQKIARIPEGEPFVCAKCGDRLRPIDSGRPRGRRIAAAAAQALIIVLGGSAIFLWVKNGASFNAPLNMAGASETPAAPPGPPPFTFSGSSFTPPPLPSLIGPGNGVAMSVVADAPPPPDPAPAPVSIPVALPPAVSQAAPPVAPAPIVAPPFVLAMAAPVVTQVAPLVPGVAQSTVPVAVPAAVTLVRLAGSNVVATKLARRLAAGYLALIGDTEISATPVADGGLDIAGMQTGQREVIKLVPASSASGFTALLKGGAEIAMSTRKPKPSEIERLLPAGDLADPTNEQIVAVQGVAVIVSPTNRLPVLTVPQLRDILTGKTRDWGEVGGKPGAITLYTLDDQDGTIDTPQDILVSRENVSPAAHPVETEQALASVVANDRTALGFVTIGNTGAARTLAVAENGAAPVLPFELAVATEDYPLTRRIYFYTGSDRSNGFVKRFSEYVSSPAGQAVVEAAGLVGLSLKAEPASASTAAPDRFRQLVAGATRVSVDFRFQPGSMELDYRSTRDLERLVAYLKAQHIASGRLILAAFADNYGSAAVNQAVSQKRGEAVAAALSRNGVAPGKVAAFASDLPVADNATAEGRERNRRVEIYLAPS